MTQQPCNTLEVKENKHEGFHRSQDIILQVLQQQFHETEMNVVREDKKNRNCWKTINKKVIKENKITVDNTIS